MQMQATSDRISKAEAIKVIYSSIQGQLQRKRDQLYDEIRSYSPPIPACDVQFNTLLETRTTVSRELSRLNSLAKQPLSWRDQLPLLEEFITASTCLNNELKQTLRASLAEMRIGTESKESWERQFT